MFSVVTIVFIHTKLNAYLDGGCFQLTPLSVFVVNFIICYHCDFAFQPVDIHKQDVIVIARSSEQKNGRFPDVPRVVQSVPLSTSMVAIV